MGVCGESAAAQGAVVRQMKVTERTRIELRRRRCERDCHSLSGPSYVENPNFKFCGKHMVWRQAKKV